MEQKPNSCIDQGSLLFANLRSTTIYITNKDLVNDDVYTKFGLILSIRSQDIEKKPKSDVNQGPQPCCKFAKN